MGLPHVFLNFRQKNVIDFVGRNRMPDSHVDVLLTKYKDYLQERMLESGRLSKGTFNEIANDLNKQFNVNFYEREQVK